MSHKIKQNWTNNTIIIVNVKHNGRAFIFTIVSCFDYYLLCVSVQ